MIADQVEIPDLFYLTDIEQWCAESLGPQAPSLAMLDHAHPWFRQWNYGDTVWYFASKNAATLFRLRWL